MQRRLDVHLYAPPGSTLDQPAGVGELRVDVDSGSRLLGEVVLFHVGLETHGRQDASLHSASSFVCRGVRTHSLKHSCGHATQRYKVP